MVIVIKGLSFDEVHDYLDSRGAGEGDIDIYIDDYGYADADRGDMRRMVEIQVNDPDDEYRLDGIMADLENEEPDAEISYL